MTDIEWCTNPDGTKGKTWNPVRGCSRISPGCDNCYAMRQARRTHGPGGAYEGLTIYRGPETSRPGVDWSGIARFVPEMLDEPLHWRKPQRVFVNSMSDLFHHSITFEQIAAIFGVMAACPQHTFMVLTKRPERAVEFYRWVIASCDDGESTPWTVALGNAANYLEGPRWSARIDRIDSWSDEGYREPWPLPNVHLGVSVENQDYVYRIAEILKCPAAVHWVSAEPLLSSLDLTAWTSTMKEFQWATHRALDMISVAERDRLGAPDAAKISWVVVGGESGPGSRPFDIGWARSIVEQCGAASVPCFVKQFGAKPFNGEPKVGGTRATLTLRNKKGSDLSEIHGDWPREYPT